MDQPDDVLIQAGEVEIGPVRYSELHDLRSIFQAIVDAGEGYPHSAPLTQESFLATWFHGATGIIGLRAAGQLVGAYYLRPNQPGRAAHIANAGYIVKRGQRRRGFGRFLVEDSILRAPLFGFDAIQFNLVFVSNPARGLYEELGWSEIGRVPRAVEGEDAIIYWRAVP